MAANVQFYNGNLKFAAVVQQFCLNFMSDTEKISSRKGKTGSIYSIIGVSLVLLIMGIMGSVFLILHQLGDSFKEEIRISAYLNTANKDTITQIQTYLKGQPFAKDVTYIDKEAAKKSGMKIAMKIGIIFWITIHYQKVSTSMLKQIM